MSSMEMSATSATRFAVEVPGQEVRTSQMDYYIEAKDRAGGLLANAGAENSPFNITILGSGDIQATAMMAMTGTGMMDDQTR